MAKARGDIFADMAPMPEIKAGSFVELMPHMARRRPFVVRGLAADWPLVKAGLNSADEARRYLLSKATDRPVPVSIGTEPGQKRIFYSGDSSMNIRIEKSTLSDVFSKISDVENDDTKPIIYLGSLDINRFFEGLSTQNSFDFGDLDPMESIWIGTRSRIAAHNDFPQNLACVAAGRRRFTLFDPKQYKNLYIGPLEHTPAGRPVSMVDFHNPDYQAFPKFRDALARGWSAELEPGDAIYIPSMWWHHIEGLEPFNILVNYWWRETPRYRGDPQHALYYALMAIRDLPVEEKQYWQQIFQDYVFENTPEMTDHIAEPMQGILGPMTAHNAQKIKTFLMRMISG